MEIFNNIYFRICYDFIFIFLLMLVLLFVFFNKKRKDYKLLKDNDIIKNYIIRYNLDMRKTNYRKVLKTITFINAFILTIGSLIILYVDKYILRVLLSLGVISILIYSLYEISGNYFRKKEEK